MSDITLFCLGYRIAYMYTLYDFPIASCSRNYKKVKYWMETTFVHVFQLSPVLYM